jgi:hypothetical protein
MTQARLIFFGFRYSGKGIACVTIVPKKNCWLLHMKNRGKLAKLVMGGQVGRFLCGHGRLAPLASRQLGVVI